MRYDPYIIGMCVQLGGSECVRMSKSEAETEGTEKQVKGQGLGKGGGVGPKDISMSGQARSQIRSLVRNKGG